jgi:hypothetical protein
MPRVTRLLGLLAAVAAIQAPDVYATPSQIIILRHGEKQDAYRLCEVGAQRSLALVARYLGKGATNSLFADGKVPDAFFAITLHTLELISPAAKSWGMPVIMYTSIPIPGQRDADDAQSLNRRTQEAVRDVLTNPQWNGKTVVMTWEHKHIADRKLEQQFLGQKVTLRQLLNLDVFKDVPESWSGDNFNYFWIVGHAKGSTRPTRFEARKQVFAAPFEAVPANDWGKPPTYPPNSRCE